MPAPWHQVRMLVVAALVVVMAGVLAGITLLRHHFAKLYAERLDPLGLQSCDETADRPAGALVLLFGDSRAAQWRIPDPPQGAIVVNRGISGQTTAQIVGRFDKHVAPLAPDVVVVQAGSNDLKCIPLFPERAEEIEQTCLQNLRELVARCTGSGSTVVLSTIFPHGRIPLYRRPFYDSRVTEATNRVNEQLRRMAGPRVLVLDTAPILAGPDGLVRSDFARDLLHLTPAGYAALNEHLVPLVAEALKSPASATGQRATPSD